MYINWPAMFDDYPNVKFEHPLIVCADAMMAWVIVKGGTKPHKNFGHVLVKVGEYLGCLPTPDGLMKFSEQNV